MALRQRRQRSVVSTSAGGEREPWYERDARLGRVFQKRLGRAVGKVEQVLHRNDRGDLRGSFDIADTDFAEADVADLALILQALEFTDLVLECNLGVDAVELHQVDALQRRVSQAHLDLLTQVLGSANGVTLSGHCRVKPAGDGKRVEAAPK